MKKRKIGTITFHWATNYGGVLQAYALQQALLKLGEDTEIIDYVPFRVRAWIVLDNIKGRRFGEFRKERSIARFRRERLCLSKRRYAFDGALKKAAADYTHIITGSDQVWNYSFVTTHGKKPKLSYFLDFAGDDVKKFSYAASFGADKMPADYESIVRSRLEKFSAISVREDTGLDIIRGMGLPACRVCDPTALLTKEDYEKLLPDKAPRAKYICSYLIHEGQATAQAVESAVTELRSDLALRRIASSDGVTEWLGAIQGAELVVTNSFHGVMLSLLMETPFIAVPVEGWAMNARVENILRSTGTSERLVSSADKDAVKKALGSPIDREKAAAALEGLRREGCEYLKHCLKD